MTGEKLLIAIRRTTTEILLIAEGFAPQSLTPAEACTLAETGRYSGIGRKRKVFQIFVTPPMAPSLPWQECWRTISAAVCAPSYGYERRSRGGFAA